MSKYKFDGIVLKDGSKVIATVKGDKIHEGTTSKVIANIRDDRIRQGSGSTVLFNIHGDDISQGTSLGSKVATMKDVDKAIEGPGKVVKAALWLLFCR